MWKRSPTPSSGTCSSALESEYSGTVKLGTNSVATSYGLRDLGRAGNYTTNMNGATAGLACTGESGGLNEANSDIFGTMVEFYVRGAQGQGAVIPDVGGNWTMGEQLETAQFPH